jgi:hypothetical protein
MSLEAHRHINEEGFARQARAAALETRIARLASHIHAANYRLIAMLRAFDALGGWHGWPSPAHWLQWRCGFSLGAAREKFRVARVLPDLPGIRAAFRRGELSFAQVRAMTRIATPDNEATVLMWARHSTASHMEKLARLYRRHGEHAAALAQHRERSFRWWEEDNGMVSFRIRLPAEEAAVVLKAIEAAKATLDGRDLEDVSAETRVERDEAADLPDGDVSAETRAQRGESPRTDGGDVSAETRAADDLPRVDPDEDVSAETRRARTADAFVRVMQAYLEPDLRPRSIAEKYQVHVHLDLRRSADGPVEDPDAPALAEETVRRLGCEAALVPVLYDGDEILSVGRRTRAIPPSIRRALRLRDRGCRFPGCTHTRHVHAHHVRHWADGGETKLSNLVELCGRHHRLLHEGGYGLEATDDGVLVFTRPDGERIPDVPRPLALEGEVIELFAQQQQRLGVSAETHRSRWDGRAPDYGAMVEWLDRHAAGGAAASFGQR